MPRKTKYNSKSSAEETALNDHAAKPATKNDSSPRKTASRKKSAPPKATTHISDEAIRTRAYFIAEQRERMSLPGDADSDWLEARRQLLAELGER
ncbi:MAG: hypothetical protein DMF40_13845 [Verrucomicrobia bacterium]|nr:MAG: hypothetical protein DMF40_13845 [Verrucomicrobiota bacterium]